MNKVLESIQRLYPLGPDATGRLAALLQPVALPKGHVLFRAGKVEKTVYFMEKGLARAFCYKDDKEITFWFGTEGDIILSYYSYIAGKPGYEQVELLEDAVLYSLTIQKLHTLYNESIAFANWGRKLADYE